MPAPPDERLVMANNNVAILIGNLGSDPTVHVNRNGKEFLRVTIATTDSYKDKKTEEWVDLPSTWHSCFAFSDYAKRDTSAFRKGMRVRIIGRITYRESKVRLENESLTFRDAIINIVKIQMAPLALKSYAKKTAQPLKQDNSATDFAGIDADLGDMDMPMDEMPDWEPDYDAVPDDSEPPVSDASGKASRKGKTK